MKEAEFSLSRHIKNGASEAMNDLLKQDAKIREYEIAGGLRGEELYSRDKSGRLSPVRHTNGPREAWRAQKY